MADEEQPLVGGRTARAIVRVSDTVRRTPAVNDQFARALLIHLERKGFDGAPRFLGVDEAGRRVISYLPGAVPDDLGHFDDAALVAAAKLIRRYHDATASLFNEPTWNEIGVEVACHNDLSPCNTVFREGVPSGLIDFDAAAPGTRAWDYGYAAWLWLDLGNGRYPFGEQIRRLRLFVESYGPPLDVSRVAAAALDRQALLECEGARLGKVEMTAWASSCRRATSQLMELLN